MHTGFRISELLSLAVADIYQHGKMVDYVTVQSRHMKKKTEGRTVRLHPEAQEALKAWIEALTKMLKGRLAPQTPVFCSRVRDKETGLRRAISREQVWRILKQACHANELTGKLDTHAMRKTFANRMYERLEHNLVKTQHALGHRNVNSTVAYLSFCEEEIEAAILAA